LDVVVVAGAAVALSAAFFASFASALAFLAAFLAAFLRFASFSRRRRFSFLL
jgi:hypothetical protein